MNIDKLVGNLKSGKNKDVHANIPTLGFSDARSLLKACFDPESFSDHTKTVKLLLENHPGLAWSTDPIILDSSLTAHPSEIKLNYLHQVAGDFPSNFLSQIRGIVATACQKMRPPMADSDKIYNFQLMLHLASRLCATDIAKLFNKESKKYYAHLMDLKQAKSFPRLEGWDEKEFLPLRIHAHVELLIYMSAGLSKIPDSELTDSMSQLEKLIDQELKTYYVVCLIKQIEAVIQKTFFESKKEKKPKLGRSCDLVKNLILKQLENLPSGDSFSLEAGWETHSVYVQFLRSENGWEVIFHDRRENEGGVPLTKSLGVVHRVEYLENYVRSFLKMRFGLIDLNNEEFYNQLSNKEKLFEPDEVHSQNLVVLPDQKVGNCVVASHDSVVANSVSRKMFSLIQAQEKNSSKEPLLHKACSDELLADFSGISLTEGVVELQQNTRAFGEYCLNSAWNKPGKKTYNQLTPKLRSYLLSYIMRAIKEKKDRYEQSCHPSSELSADEKKSALSDYINSLERLTYFESLPTDAILALLEGFKKLDERDDVGTSRIMDAALRMSVNEQGKLSDSNYQLYYAEVKAYLDEMITPGQQFSCLVRHKKSYVFFSHSDLFRDADLVKLLEEAIPYACVVDDPPEEIYHYAVVGMYDRAWATQADVIKNALKSALSSDNVAAVRGAITLIGANCWLDDLSEELKTLLRKKEDKVGFDSDSIPTPDANIDFFSEHDQMFLEDQQKTLEEAIDATPTAEWVDKFKTYFFDYLEWGTSGRVSYQMLKFIVDLAEKKELMTHIKEFIREAFFSEEKHDDWFLCKFGLPPVFNLKSCFKELAHLVRDHFSPDEISALFSQAKSQCVKNEYIAAALVEVNFEKARNLYGELVESGEKEFSRFLFRYLANGNNKKLHRSGVFCQMVPPPCLGKKVGKSIRKSIKSHAKQEGMKLLSVKRVREHDEAPPVSPRFTSQ